MVLGTKIMVARFGKLMRMMMVLAVTKRKSENSGKVIRLSTRLCSTQV